SLVEYIQGADLVLSVGTRFSQVTTQDYTLLNEKSELIQVDISPDSIGKAYPADVGIVSDAKKFLKKCLDQAAPVKDPEREKRVQERHEAYLAHSTPPSPSGSGEFAEMNAVIAEVTAAV